MKSPSRAGTGTRRRQRRVANRAPLSAAMTLCACAALSAVGLAWASTNVHEVSSPGAGGMTLAGSAGGPVQATRFGVSSSGPCMGFVGETPNHVVQLGTSLAHAELAVRAPADTTLVVRGPNGVRCVDDGDGTNPVLRGAFEAGRYEIYVGTFESSGQVSYTMRFRTLPE